MTIDVNPASITQTETTGTFVPAEPLPLFRALPAAAAYPVKALGPDLERVAMAIHDITQAPVAICAQAILGAVALAVQAHANVAIPTGDVVPSSLFLLTIAGSGERKSACDKLAQRGIVRRVQELVNDHKDQAQAFANDREAWEKARGEAIGSRSIGMAAKRSALDAVGPEPQPPLAPMLTVDEPTYEGMFKLLQHGQPSLGLFAAEAATFLGGHGMSEDAKTRMAGGLTHLWDGTPLSRVRSGEAVTLRGRRLSISLMAQPSVAALLLKDKVIAGAGGQGLLNRVLIVAPDSTAGTRFFRPRSPDSDEIINSFADRLHGLLATPMPMADGTANELEPRELSLSVAAVEVWTAFQHETETRLGPDGDLRPIVGLVNRLPEHATRLAAVQALFCDLDAEEVPLEAMQNGIELAQYYANEALRSAEAADVSADIRKAEQVRHWLMAGWDGPLISLPDLYQFGPNCIRESAPAKRAVNALVEHGHLIAMPPGTFVKGKKRNEVWRIIGK